MDCIIPGLNLKVMVKAVQALSKIGDELYLNAKPEHLSLMTMNMSRTAYVTLNLLDTFFSSYSLTDSYSENLGGCICKISMKAISGIFKGHKEKTVELCKMQLSSDETKLVITFKYKYDATVTHNLRLSEPETLSIVCPTDDSVNHISASSSYYNQLLAMFQPHDEDISWEITETKAVVRNYDTRILGTQKAIRTQVALNATEFAAFRINQEASITFSLKPFRSAIQFAESFHLHIAINFETPGKPAVFVMKNPTFEMNFIVATMLPEGTTQTTMSSTPSMPPIKMKNTKRKEKANMTIQDKAALDGINWEDDFEFNIGKAQKKTSKPNFVDIMNDLKQKRAVRSNNATSENDDSLDVHDSPNDKDLEEEEVIPNTPESPRTKRLKLVFGRCFEPTFHPSQFEVLVENSDPDSDMDTN